MPEKKRSVCLEGKRIYIPLSFFVEENKFYSVEDENKECITIKEGIYMKWQDIEFKVCSVEDCFWRHGLRNSSICNKHPDYKKLGICEGCNKRACYGFPDTNKARRCKTHKQDGMKNLKAVRCLKKGCDIIPGYAYPDKRAAYCVKHKKKGMIYITNRKCKNDSCDRQCTFGYEGSKPEYCVTHKLINMVDVHSNRCEIEKCYKQPSFGYEGSKAVRCKKHKKSDMKDLKHGKLCEREGCKIRACFGVEFGNPINCVTHSLKGMINVVSKRCERCDKVARYGKDEKTIKYCKYHKLDGMVSRKYYQICKSCDKVATYGYTDHKPEYCNSCKVEDMVLLRAHIVCIDCNVRIGKHSYGYTEETPSRCHLHAKKGMLRYSRTRCEIEECEEYATHGESKPNHCIEHKKSNEFDLRVRKCTECKTLAVLTKEKLCGDCDPISGYRTRMAKQREIKKYLDREEIHYDSYDRIIDTDKVIKYRPDFLFLNENKKHAVILEVDEYQHIAQKEDDHQRMLDLQEHLQRPVIFIRYNPDEYRSGDETKRTSGEKQSRRKRLLLSVIQQSLEKKIKKGRVVYLYFDGWNEEITYDYIV